MTNDELKKRNVELREALENAEDLRVSAEAAEAHAETEARRRRSRRRRTPKRCSRARRSGRRVSRRSWAAQCSTS